MTQPSLELDGPPGTGPVRWLAGAAALLALVFCLLGFVGGIGVSDLAGVFVVGAGLLAGTAALPRAGRVLAPCAVAVTLGVLMLLQAIMTSRVTGLLVAALVVAFVEMVTVVGALLVDLGVVARHPERPSAPAPEAPPLAPWNPAPSMGPPVDPTTTYVGSYGGPPSAPGTSSAAPTAVVPAAPSSDVFPVGPSGGAPRYGLSGPPSAPSERATEAVPRPRPTGGDQVRASGPPSWPAAANGSGDLTTAVPRYGLSPTGSTGPGGTSEFNGRVNGSVAPPASSPISDEQLPTTAYPASNGHGGRAPGGPGEPEQAGGATGSVPRPGFSPSGVPLSAAPAVNGAAPTPGQASDPKNPAGQSAASAPSPGPRDNPAGFAGDAPSPQGRFRTGAPTAPGSTESSAAREDQTGLRSAEASDVSATLPTHNPPSAGPMGASPLGPTGAHRAASAEAGSPSASVPSPGRSAGRTGAHRAMGPETSVFALSEPGPVVGRDRPTPGVPAPDRAGAGDDALPRRVPSPTGASSGYHTPLPFVPFEDRSPSDSPPTGRQSGTGPSSAPSDADRVVPGGLFQPAARGGASHPGLSLSGPAAEPRSARPDPTPATTVFRSQPAPDAHDATPAWGHSTFDGANESRASALSWLSPTPGTAEPEVPARRLPLGEHRRGADGHREQPDHADPEATRFFPTAER